MLYSVLDSDLLPALWLSVAATCEKLTLHVCNLGDVVSIDAYWLRLVPIKLCAITSLLQPNCRLGT